MSFRYWITEGSGPARQVSWEKWCELRPECARHSWGWTVKDVSGRLEPVLP